MQPKTKTALIYGSGTALAVALAMWARTPLPAANGNGERSTAAAGAEVGRRFREGYEAGQSLAAFRLQARLRTLSAEEVAAKSMSASAGKLSLAHEVDAFDQGFQTGYRAGRKERSAAR